MKKTIGILGGMGPEATVRLFRLIVEGTKAENDQEHIPIIIYNNPKIPDRTGAITGQNESPLPALIEGSKFLEKAGADFIVMPCHTAHHYFDEIIKEIGIPFLHLQRETVKFVEKEFPVIKHVGLVATTGTVKTGLFPSVFAEGSKGIQIMEASPRSQELVMEAIYGEHGIKAGHKEEPRHLLLGVIREYKVRKAEAIIAGCTEVSLALQKEEMGLPVIEPLRIMAQKAIQEAGYPLK